MFKIRFITRNTPPEVADALRKSWRIDHELKLAGKIVKLVVRARAKKGLTVASIARVMKITADELKKLGIEQ